MTYLFSLKGEVPAKKNSRITLRTGKTIPSKRYQEWHEISLIEIMRQKREMKITSPVNEACHIAVNFTHGDKRRRDCDNGLSSVLDLLVDCKILEDDKWEIVRECRVTNDYVKGSPLCEIMIVV